MKALAGVLLCVVACRPRGTAVDGAEVLAKLQDRHILGAGQMQAARLDVDEDELARSATARRAYAWDLARRVLAPAGISNPVTGEPLVDKLSGRPLTVPVWQTWYEAAEVGALVEDLYLARMSPADRDLPQAPAALVDAAMADAAQRALPSHWTTALPGGDNRFTRRLAQIDGDQAARSLNGVSGAGYTLFSPALVRHLLLHYKEVATCAPAAEPSSAPLFGRCTGGKLPKDAVAIKTTWMPTRRPVAEWDTSAAGLTHVIEDLQGNWDPTDRPKSLVPAGESFTAGSYDAAPRLVETYQLTGMHIIAREVSDWAWTTLWWSKTPGQDFGEDRPAAFDDLPDFSGAKPWSHYKMCASIGFTELDLKLGGDVAASAAKSPDTSLQSALVAAHKLGGASTLCSNPFIESFPAGARSNCVGCHQHSGPLRGKDFERSIDLAKTEARFDGDYLWSYDASGESFRTRFRAVVFAAAQ